MPHGGAAAGFEILTRYGKDLVRRIAHQRNELSPVLQIHRTYAGMGLGVGGAVPVQIGAARTPAVPSVLGDGDLCVRRVVGAGDVSELAADR